MSRVGKAPVYFEKDVSITVSPDNLVTVKGPKVSQTVQVRPEIMVKVGEGVIECTPKSAEHAAFHGLTRALLQNAVTGVSKGILNEG